MRGGNLSSSGEQSHTSVNPEPPRLRSQDRAKKSFHPWVTDLSELQHTQATRKYCVEQPLRTQSRHANWNKLSERHFALCINFFQTALLFRGSNSALRNLSQRNNQKQCQTLISSGNGDLCAELCAEGLFMMAKKKLENTVRVQPKGLHK